MRLTRASWIAVSGFCVAFGTSAPVSAQPASAEAEAAAAAQFDRGLAAMNEEKYDVACPALAESVRLDARPGAVFTLAECEAKWGRIASADAHYADYLARYARMTEDQQRQQRGREKIAAQRRAELRSRIPQLMVQLPADAPANAVVKRDGIVLGAPSLGVHLPVDPGTHILTVEIPGATKTEKSVTLEIGGRDSIVLDVPSAPPPVVPVEPPPAATSPRAGTPWLAYGAFAVGAFGVGIGTIFGVSAISKTSTVDERCNGNLCDREGKLAADDAQRWATFSTGGFIVGGAGVALGVVLLLLRPSDPPRTARGARPFASVDPRGGFFGAAGTF